MEQPINLKNEMKNIGFGFLYILALWVIIYFFKPNTWALIGILCLGVIGMTAYGKLKKGVDFTYKGLLFTFGYIAALVWFMQWLGKYGLLGYFISTGLICIIILVKKRGQYIATKHHIETMIWGQPLYKFREAGIKPPTWNERHS